MKKVFLGLSIAVLSIFATLNVVAAPAKAPASTPALLEKGKASYAMNCLMCHGDKGDGNGVAGAAMNPKPRNFAKDKFKNGNKVDAIFKSVSEGLTGTAMAGFGHLPETDRWGLAYYVLSFKPKK